MTKEQRKKLYNLLLSIRRELVYQMKTIKNGETEASAREVTGDLSGYSFHLADQATDTMDHQKNFINIERESETLHDIDDALEKINNGLYGKCEDCGKEIGLNRLEVLPYARLCIECKARDEANRIRYNDAEDYRHYYKEMNQNDGDDE